MSIRHSHKEKASRVPFSSGGSLHGWLGTLVTWLIAAAATCATYLRAAARYEDLRRLSDAELARRNLDRATLGHEVCKDCERDAHS